jgi:hypothetical protein
MRYLTLIYRWQMAFNYNALFFAFCHVTESRCNVALYTTIFNEVNKIK